MQVFLLQHLHLLYIYIFTYALFVVHFMNNVRYVFYIKRFVRLDSLWKLQMWSIPAHIYPMQLELSITDTQALWYHSNCHPRFLYLECGGEAQVSQIISILAQITSSYLPSDDNHPTHRLRTQSFYKVLCTCLTQNRTEHQLTSFGQLKVLTKIFNAYTRL